MINCIIDKNMKKQNTLITLLILVLVSCGIFADAKAQNARERMEVIKKMKMLEALGLDEAKSEKFLIKYNCADAKIKDNFKEIRNKSNELEKILSTNNSEEIKKVSDELVALQETGNKLVNEKVQIMRGCLTPEEFAKYLIFEEKFHKEMFNALKDGRKMQQKSDNPERRRPAKNKTNK